MKEITGNIWDFHKAGKWIAITTNGSIRRDGYAVMGRGVARQAAMRFHGLQKELGNELLFGNFVYKFNRWRLFTFPVKHAWNDKADLDLIHRSAQVLEAYVTQFYVPEVYLVRPGCGNGKLDWKDVKPILTPIFDDRFIIVEAGPHND